MWIRPFVSTFHTLKYSIWAKSDENFLQKVLPTYFSTVHNLRLGSINLEPRNVVEIFGKFVKRQVCVKKGDELPTAEITFDKNKSQYFMLSKRRFWKAEQSVA
jgi:hypothetical protein